MPPFCPWHGLFFHKTFAEHVINGRLHKRRRNGFPVTIPLAIVGNEGTIALEVSTEFLHRCFEAWQAGVGVGKVINAPIKISKAAQRLVGSNTYF